MDTILASRFDLLNAQQQKLTLAAIMLYLGEGAKTGRTVDIANSSAAILKVFLNFLREVCQIDENRLKLYLYCFSDQDINALITYWSKQLSVSKKQFTKPYIRDAVRPSTRRMPYGVLHLRYSDKKLFTEIENLSRNLCLELGK